MVYPNLHKMYRKAFSLSPKSMDMHNFGARGVYMYAKDPPKGLWGTSRIKIYIFLEIIHKFEISQCSEYVAKPE